MYIIYPQLYVLFNVDVMNRYNYNPHKYSSVFSLQKLDGAKVMKICTDNGSEKVLVFNGTCNNKTYLVKPDNNTEQARCKLERQRESRQTFDIAFSCYLVRVCDSRPKQKTERFYYANNAIDEMYDSILL